MHLCTENIRSRIRSPRSLPSKIHAATPPQNLAAVESLLRAKRAARSSFSWPHGLLSERNREDQHAFYLAAAFPIGTKWLGALFTYVRHSVLPRHSYDLASYGLRGVARAFCAKREVAGRGLWVGSLLLQPWFQGEQMCACTNRTWSAPGS